jgi:hypothetical protein
MTSQLGGPGIGTLDSLGWFNLRDYDDLREAITAVDTAGGGVLYIPPGVHVDGYLESSVPAPQKPLVILGAGAGLSILDGADEQCLLGIQGHVALMHLTIRNFRRMALLVTAPVARLRVNDVIFRSIGTDGFGHGLFGSVSVSGEVFTGPIEDVQVTRCTFEQCYGGINLRADDVRNVNITDNVFRDLRRWAVRIGDDPPDKPASTGQWILHRNLVENVVNSEETEIHAFQCFGTSVSIQGNIVTEIRGAKESDGERPHCEGIYVKAAWSEISHNLLTNAGYTEAAIVLKGKRRAEEGTPGFIPGFGTRVLGNTILFDGRSDRSSNMVGIQIQTDDVLCADNHIEGANRAGIRVEAFAPGVVIRSNTINRIHESRSGFVPMGVFASGSHTVIEENVISNLRHSAGGSVRAIEVVRSKGILDDLTIRNNIVHSIETTGESRSLTLDAKNDGRMRHVRVTGNSFQSTGVGVVFDSEPERIEDCRLTDNDFIEVDENTRFLNNVANVLEFGNRTLPVR